jgi:hypothetical protein
MERINDIQYERKKYHRKNERAGEADGGEK